MALVHDQQEVFREIVDQRKRRGTRFAAREHARIVFNAAAKADLLQHLDVIPRALCDALRLDQLAVFLEVSDARVELLLQIADRGLQLVLGRDIVARRKDRGVPQLAQRDAGQRVDAADAVDLVAEELDAHHVLVRIDRPDLDRVPAHAEAVALEHHIVALILDVDQAADKGLAADLGAGPQRDDHFLIVDRVAQRVDAGHGRDDDHVPPLGQRRGRRVAQAVDLVVDGRVLFDIGVGRGDIRLGLVIVVIGDEILDRIVREELAQLGAELRGKRFIVCEHQRRPLGLLDDVGHGEGLARAGHAHQRLLGQAVADALDQLCDGLGLVARHFVRADDLEFRHGSHFLRFSSSVRRYWSIEV